MLNLNRKVTGFPEDKLEGRHPDGRLVCHPVCDRTRPRGRKKHMVSCQNKAKLTNLMINSRIEG